MKDCCCKQCKVVFMLLGKCASMQTSSCALERWYGRWGGGEGPRGEHTPPAYVRLFQNTGQHLVIFYERCAQTRVSLLTSTLIFRAVSGLFFSVYWGYWGSKIDFIFTPPFLLKLCVVTAGYFYARAQGQCLGLFWSKSTSRNKSRITVSWNVRMVSLRIFSPLYVFCRLWNNFYISGGNHLFSCAILPYNQNKNCGIYFLKT